MLEVKRKNILFLLLLIVCFIWQTKNACAVNFFSKDRYIVPQGKSILLSPECKNPDHKFRWISENTDVASVDSNGVVYAKSRGKSTITIEEISSGEISTCILEVDERDPFRIVFPEPNSVSANENFKIKAVTYKDVESLKFEITGERYSKSVECREKTNYEDYYFWKKDLSLPRNGNYHIKAYAKIGNAWKTCEEGNTDVTISEKYDRNIPSLTEKKVSNEGADMIARFEGSCPHVYKDTVGILTIGYGKPVYPYEVFYNNLSRIEMSNMFLHMLSHSTYSKSVNKFLIENKIKFNQQQFDALVSFSYNLGCGWINSNSDLSRVILDCSNGENNVLCGIVNSSDGLWVRSGPSTSTKKLRVLKNREKVEILDPEKVNEKWYKVKTNDNIEGYCYGDYMDTIRVNKDVKNLSDVDKTRFIEEFSRYHHAGGKCIKGLVKRRFGELNLFFNGKYDGLCNFDGLNAPYPIPQCAKSLF